MVTVVTTNKPKLLLTLTYNLQLVPVVFFRKIQVATVLSNELTSPYLETFIFLLRIFCTFSGRLLGRISLSAAATAGALLVALLRVRRLAATTQDHCPGVVFSPSGSEAVEVALKTARVVTGRPEIISVHGAYHGHTGLAAMAGDARYHEPFGINLPDFNHLPHNDLAAMENRISDATAAVILETIPATLGMAIPHEGYLARIKEICKERGALLILDEIQTGLGRSGKFWGYEYDEVVPDLVVTGKGLGGGIYPIAATLMTPEVHKFYDDEPFVQVSSYGGSDIGCAVGLAVLDIVESPGFLARVEELGDRFEQKLSCRGEIRRRGLFIGIKWPDEGAGILAAKACIDAGVFAVFANNDTSVLQFLPALTITDSEADEIINIVNEALS